MHRRFFASIAVACALVATLAMTASPARAVTQVNRVIYIMMENQGFDDIIGHDNPQGLRDTPYISDLAFRYGLNTLTFGTTHPSLPNYLSLFTGDIFGIHDDNPSCYAVPKQSPCDAQAENATSLVDELEAKKLTWVEFEQSMPTVGFMGPQWPASSSGPVHYAQKHNPLAYIKSVATNSARLKHIVPLNSMTTLATYLGSATASPNFVFIVPDQCHDMHGTSDCPSGDALLQAGDQYVQQLVTTITHSKAYTANTVIVIAWDEDDYSSNTGCCKSPFPGGGHTPFILISPAQAQPYRSQMMQNHYSELRSIEDWFGLPHIGNAAYEGDTLFDLLP